MACLRLSSSWVVAFGTPLFLLACSGTSPGVVPAAAGCGPTSDAPAAIATTGQAPQILGPDGRPLPGSGAPTANETIRAGDLTLSNGHIISFSGGPAAIGGFTIRNDGERDDRLISISSPLAESIAIVQIDPEQGEVEVTTQVIAAGEAFTSEQMTLGLNRGRLSLRFRGLRLPENPGEGVPVFLEFERAGCVPAHVFPVVRRG